MTDIPSYVTRVQFAVPEALLPPLQALLKKQPEYEIVKPGIASGDSILQDIDHDHPDILVLDLGLPCLNVDDFLTTLSARNLRPHVLVIGTRQQLQPEIQSYRAVRGVLPRDLATSRVFHSVLAGLADGCRYFMALPASDPSQFQLNKGETVMLALMVLGLDADELALLLGRTLNAIYIRQVRMRRKLEVDSPLKATAKAFKIGLVGALTEVED